MVAPVYGPASPRLKLVVAATASETMFSSVPPCGTIGAMGEGRSVGAVRSPRTQSSLAASAFAAAKERIVGRDAEIALLRGAIEDRVRRPALIVVCGAPGVGKTALALLAHLSALAERKHSVFLPAAQAAPTPPGVREGLADLGLQGGFDDLGHGSERTVLIVDGFEHLARIASWFFSELLARAGANLSLVITSRRSMRAELAPFRTLFETSEIELANLEPTASAELLAQAGVDPALHARVHEATCGHPLALTLLAHDVTQLRALGAADEGLPEAVSRILAARFASEATTAAEREALSALVVPRACDETMLAQLLGAEDAASAYDWLRSLPYVQETTQGLAPHDLIREVVFADLARRAPESVAELGARAVGEYLRRMSTVGPAEQWPLFLDGLHALRANPAVSATFGVEQLRSSWLDRGTDADVRWASAEIERVEGSACARAFEHCVDVSPQLLVVRDAESEPVAIQHLLPHDAEIDPERVDPVMWRACELAREVASRRRAAAFACRFWLARRTYLGFGPELTSMMTLGPLVTATHDPSPWLVIAVTHDVERWRQLSAISPLELVESTTVDGIERGFWLLDPTQGDPELDPHALARAAFPTWLAMLARRPDADPAIPSAPQPVPGEVSPDAVREALGAYHQAYRLQQTALARSLDEGQDPAEGCRLWLLAGIQCMADSPAHADLAAVLERTYIEPAVKQRAAAAELNLPWGTYRHRLRRAVVVLAQELGRLRSRAERDEVSMR